MLKLERVCSTCGYKRQADLREAACPLCKAQYPAIVTRSARSAVAAAVLTALVIWFLWPSSRQQDEWKNGHQEAEAYVMVKRFVKERLKAPATAQFAPDYENGKWRAQSIGGSKYRVVAYVDSQNSFGANLRSYFVAEMEQVDRDHWKLILLELD